MKKCDIEGCDRQVERTAVCRRCYKQVWRAKNPDKVRAHRQKGYHKNPEKARARSAAYRAANPEKVKEANRTAYWANPEKRRQYSRDYHLANLEETRAKARAAYHADAERRKAVWREYYTRNSEKLRAASRATSQAHPERVLAYSRKNRIRRREFGKHVPRDGWNAAQKPRDLPCARCGKAPPSQVDHILPLRWADVPEVAACLAEAWCFQPLCGRCNADKQARRVEAYIPTGDIG